MAYGFDACFSPLPSVSDMQTIWNNSPDYFYNFYIGGLNAYCPAGINRSWLDSVNAIGWNFTYTTVALQPPCGTGFTYTFSADPTTAYTQGQQSGEAAINALLSDDVQPAATPTPIIYDLKSAGNGTCQTAITSFVSGFDNWLNLSGYDPGVYGSICGSNLAALGGASPPPLFIWGADPDGNPNNSIMQDGPGGCGVPSGDWVYNQRLKQYSSGGPSSYYGVYFPYGIDYDCADSFTSPNGGSGNCN